MDPRESPSFPEVVVEAGGGDPSGSIEPRLLESAGKNFSSVPQRSEMTLGASLCAPAFRPAAMAGEIERTASRRRTHVRNRTVRAIDALLTERLRFPQ
jgi:hypothetical protein